MASSAAWTDARVLKLIDLWREDGIQAQLEGSTRNKHVYARLATELNKSGFKITGEQCRTKMKKLRQEYKKIKDKNNLTGRGRAKWKYFDVLNDILGNRPSTRPQVVIDTTTDDGKENSKPSAAKGDAKASNGDAKEASDGDDAKGDAKTNAKSKSTTNGTAGNEEENIGDVSESETDTSRPATPVHKGKRQNQSKADMFEGIMTKVVKTMSDGLRDSDRLFLEFEERRMKENQQFQLQMAQLLAGQLNSSSSALPPALPPTPYYPSYSGSFYGTAGPTQHYPQGPENIEE